MSKIEPICIYCQSKNYSSKYKFQDIYEDQYSLLKCLDCETYFLNPKPSEKQLARAYNEEYYGKGEKKFNPTVEKVIDLFRSFKAKGFSRYLPGQGKVLDIGCGNGHFLHYLGKCGEYELHGIEPEGKSAERAEKYKEIRLLKGPLTESSYQENSFDAISLIHVFEHLPNPREIIEIITRIGKPKAILYIEMPNIDSWQARFYKGDWLHLDPPRHLNLMSPERLKKNLHDFGWELIAESYFSPQFSPFGVQQSLLNRICSKREVLYEYLKGNSNYVKEYSWMALKLMQLFHWVTFPLFVFTDAISAISRKGGTFKLIFRKLD